MTAVTWDRRKMELIARQLLAGETVSFRPAGNSMTPRIRSRQLVTVSPAKDQTISKGDVVLARVHGVLRLHLVTAVDGERVQIGNSRGHVNGWTTLDRVYGKADA